MSVVQLSPSFQVPGILASLTPGCVCILSFRFQGDCRLSRVSKGEFSQGSPLNLQPAEGSRKLIKHYFMCTVHLILELACDPGRLQRDHGRLSGFPLRLRHLGFVKKFGRPY